MKLEFNSIEELKDFATAVLKLGGGASEAVEKETALAVPVTSAPIAPTAEKTYTRDELIKAAMPLVDTKLSDLQALMSKYNIATINDLQESQFGAFAADVRALGGAI
nr:MAG TPA: hypothetical protein [Caudoviricetes sp.]